MISLQELSPARARELAILTELEACWENLRDSSPRSPVGLKELQQKQKAYEAFHVKLVAYNKGHGPAHIPDLLLNTADRLSAWCQSMVALYVAVQDDQAYPAHLLEKAYRWANRLSDRMNMVRMARAPSPHTVAAAILELQDLARWSASLCPAKLAG